MGGEGLDDSRWDYLVVRVVEVCLCIAFHV